jgi:hypothetical protein
MQGMELYLYMCVLLPVMYLTAMYISPAQHNYKQTTEDTSIIDQIRIFDTNFDLIRSSSRVQKY